MGVVSHTGNPITNLYMGNAPSHAQQMQEETAPPKMGAIDLAGQCNNYAHENRTRLYNLLNRIETLPATPSSEARKQAEQPSINDLLTDTFGALQSESDLISALEAALGV